MKRQAWLIPWALHLVDEDIYICDNQGGGYPELQFKGRMLRLRIRDNKVVKTTVVAKNMEHPNGVRIRGNYMYVTQSLRLKLGSSGLLLVVSTDLPLMMKT